MFLQALSIVCTIEHVQGNDCILLQIIAENICWDRPRLSFYLEIIIIYLLIFMLVLLWTVFQERSILF